MPTDPAPTPTPPTPAPVPLPLKIAAALVAAEGVLVAVLGIAEAVTVDTDRLVLGATTTAFLLAYGVGLVLVARGLLRAATWSRGPTVFAQLIQILVAWSFWGGGTKWVSVLLALVGLAVLVAIFQRSSTAALADDPGRDDHVL